MTSTDRDTLVALFRSNGGDGWRRKDKWETDAELSKWYGVRVDREGRVVKIHLITHNLKGTIPEVLGNLEALQELKLIQNQLEGPIPPELGRLGALQRLSVWKNQLTGPIPVELCAVRTLMWLNVSNNQLSGPIPEELGGLSQLLELQLSNNKFTGEIPESLGQLVKLREFHLFNKQLTGPIPESLGQLGRLWRFDLGSNQLTGAIPTSLGNFSELQSLGLSSNQLTGTIPTELGDLPVLTGLNLSNNRLEGPVPRELGALSELTMLLLNDNALTGSIPKELGALGKLETMLVNDNALEGPFPTEMGGMSSLVMFRFHHTNLTGGPGKNESVSKWICRLQKGLTEQAVEQKRLEDQARRVEEQVLVAQALRRETEAAASVEAEKQRLREVSRDEEAVRRQQALHTPVGRWLVMEANFSDAQAARFCAGLEELGISGIQALKVQKEAEQEQLALELKMNRFETTMFTNAVKALRSKPSSTGVPSFTPHAGASFVNLVQLREGGGMATVFTANQLLGGPDSSSSRPVVLKRSDKDQPAAYQRERRVLQYLSRPGGAAQGFVIQLVEAYSTPEYNFIAMEQGGQNLLARVEESKVLPLSERKTKLELWGQQACQVLVALHDLGIVWGDVKPNNFVCRGDKLVAVDFGSACVEAGTVAQRELGADADTSFTSRQSDQFAWSVQYAAPERAKNDRMGVPCVARRSQDVWSLGMVLYFMATGGSPYFPSPEEKTEAAIARFREETRQALSDTTFRVNLRDVFGTAWRCSLRLALITGEEERGTASEVLEVFSRGMQGLVSTVSKTRGMEYIVQKLAVISENQQEVLRRTGTIAGNVDRVLQEQIDLRRRVAAMSTVLEHLAMDEMRMPHTLLVLPEKDSKFPRPKQWFADRGKLRFVCSHCLELVRCGEDGTGFLVSQPKEWMKKHATLLQVTVMAIVAAAAVASTAISGGALGPIAASLSLPFEVSTLDDAYNFLSGVGGEEMDRLLGDISDALDPTKSEVGLPSNVRRVKEVTGAEYRSVLHYLDTECQGWDRQMGGMERALSADGVLGWVCPRHRLDWMSAEVKGSKANDSSI
eukprot:g12086.t1